MFRVSKILTFISSFIVGLLLVLTFNFFIKNRKLTFRQKESQQEKLSFTSNSTNSEDFYNETLSEKLFNEVKVLCMVMTHPENYKTKAIHVKATWGKRCNKLLFFSSQADENLDVVVLPLEESRFSLWYKTRKTFKYAYENHINEFDWFLKADDDNYIILENLRYLLAHYNPETSLYFGSKLFLYELKKGYMAGGGYVLSKKAVQDFQEKIANNESICHSDGFLEDVEMGFCLTNHAIFVDAHDENHQKQFFLVGVEHHLTKDFDPNHWLISYLYQAVPQGSMNCCSDTSVSYHYVGPKEIYFLDFLIYQVHPFGLEKYSNEELPKKYIIEEVIAASNNRYSKNMPKVFPKPV